MKTILSRKGFDSTRRFGGGPSPIFDGRRLLSLPIPEDTRKNIIRYSEVSDPSGHFPSLGPLVKQLTAQRPTADERLTGDSFAHLDPDLRRSSFPRSEGFWARGRTTNASMQPGCRRRGLIPFLRLVPKC